MYRSNRSQIYRPTLHSSSPPDLCPHPQLSDEVAGILNSEENTSKQFGCLLTFASRKKKKLYNVYPTFWALILHEGGGGCLMLNGIKSQFGVTCASTHFVFHTGISPLSNLPNNSNTMQWSQLCRSMLCEAVCRLQLNLLHCSGGRAVHFAVKQMHRKQINIADIAHFPLYFRMHITLCSARQTYRWLQYHGFSPHTS